MIHEYTINYIPLWSYILNISRYTLWLSNVAMENVPVIDDSWEFAVFDNGDFPVHYVRSPEGILNYLKCTFIPNISQ